MGQKNIEDLYQSVGDWQTRDDYTAQEKLAIEFAERYCLNHQSMDDAFYDRLRTAFTDEEILDLATCCGMFLGLGRMLAVLGVRQNEPMRL
jgi:alkylhydroperoxidase family enzyme